MPKRLQWMFKKCAHSPETTKSFLTKLLLIDMFLLACGSQFGPPCLEWYTEKTKKCSLDFQKKSEKVKFPSKLFFQLPIWRRNSSFINKAAKFPAANPTFPCPKSEIFSQSQHNVFVKVFLLTLKKHVDDSVQNFAKVRKVLAENSK